MDAASTSSSEKQENRDSGKETIDKPLGQHEPFRTGSILDPVRLPRRGTFDSVAQKTGDFCHRLRNLGRNQLLDQLIAGISKTPLTPVPPRSRCGPAQYHPEQVLAKVILHDRYSSGYPEFDSLEFSIRSRTQMEDLWRRETNRLMNIARKPDLALKFSCQGFFPDDPERGYRELSKLCQKILTAMTVCILENECINTKHCSLMANRERLSSLISQVSNGQSAAKCNPDRNDPQAEKKAQKDLKAVNCLIDYISAVLTRMVVQTSPSRHWQENILAVLIKRITKIKAVLNDLHENAAVSIESGKAALSSMPESPNSTGRAMNEEEECEEFLRVVEANEKEGTASDQDREIASHCVEQNKFRLGLNAALRYVLMSMRFTHRSGLPATSFEICAVAYETGFEGFKALLFQDRDLEYSATSDLDNMNTAHSAFNILNHTVAHLHMRQLTGEHHGDWDTKLEWAYSGSENESHDPANIDLVRHKEPLCLRSMDEIITVMVPLAMASPVFLAEFTNFRHVIALTGLIRDDVQPYEEGHFSAFFRMYTNRFDKEVERRDVLRLPEAWHSGFFARSILVRGPDDNSQDVPQPKAQQKALHQLDELTKKMGDWVIDENSVTVQCGTYVWSVIAVAVMFASGGLAIGFSVGQRINGVDPSNLATYLWVVSAFIVLIGKSMKVKEWSWNDFLRRRVRCCSVSELQSITRIDAQLIIAKLLHDERRGSVLKIRGPYNSVFLSRSTDGFSIDRPISSSTLLLSGLILLKVVTAKGHALVCLDSRKGTELRVIGHNTDPQKEHLFCDHVDRLKASAREGKIFHKESPSNVKLPFSRSTGLKWKRVQGIYKFMDAKLV